MRRTSSLIESSASHRSMLRWRLSQNSGELPNKRDNRRAIPGLTARRSRSSSFAVWRDTPSALAKPLAVRSYSGRNSSRRISPGWIGRRFSLLLFGMPISCLTANGSRILPRRKRGRPRTESKCATGRWSRSNVDPFGPQWAHEDGYWVETWGPAVQWRR